MAASTSFSNLLDRTPEVVTMICANLHHPSALAFSFVSRAARPISMPFVFSSKSGPLKISDLNHFTVAAKMSDTFRHSCRSVRVLLYSFDDKEDAVSRVSQLLPKFENLHTVTIDAGIFDHTWIAQILSASALSTLKQLCSLSLDFLLTLERDAQRSINDTTVSPRPLPYLHSLDVTCQVPRQREDDEDPDSDSGDLAKQSVSFLHDIIFAHLPSIASLSVSLWEEIVDRDSDLARRFNLDFSLLRSRGDLLKDFEYCGPIFEDYDVLDKLYIAFPNLTILTLRNCLPKAAPWKIHHYEVLKRCRSLKSLTLPFAPHSFDGQRMLRGDPEDNTIPSQYRQITHALALENPRLEEVQWEWYHVFCRDAGPEEFSCKIFVLRDSGHSEEEKEKRWELEYNVFWGCGSSRDRSKASHHPSPPLKDIRRRVF